MTSAEWTLLLILCDVSGDRGFVPNLSEHSSPVDPAAEQSR